MSAILAGYYLRKTLAEGVRVDVGGRQGSLERVGPVDSLFRTNDGSWSIPNRQLMASIVERQTQMPGQEQ